MIRAPHPARHAERLRFIDPVDDPAWRLRAACIGVDPEMFFPPTARGPEPRDGREPAEVRRAKRVCAACPVTDACREFALSIPHVHGVRGGLSAQELAAMRHRRADTERTVDG